MNPIIDQFRAQLGNYDERDLAQEIGMQSAHKSRYLSIAKTCPRGTQGKRTQVVLAWECRARVRWARQELARIRQDVVKGLMQAVFGSAIPA